MTGLTFRPIDGIVGAKTRKALRIYQELYGLPETGEFEASTVARLRGTYETPAKAA